MEISIKEKCEMMTLGSLGKGDFFLDSENKTYIILDTDLINQTEVYSLENECITRLPEGKKVRYISPNQIKITIALD